MKTLILKKEVEKNTFQPNEVFQTKERMWCQSTVEPVPLLLVQIETDSDSAELWATIPVPTHTTEQCVT